MANNTLELKCGLKEKFEDNHFDNPTSIDSSFKASKKSHNAKRIKKIKNQSVKPSDEKLDEEDIEQKEPVPNPKAP